MKFLIYIIFTMFCSGCALFQSNGAWTKTDMMLEGTWLTLQAIDYGQTLKIADNPQIYHEHNPILGEHPSRTNVHMYMLATGLLHSIISRKLSQPHRKIWQGFTIIGSADCVYNNYMLGLSITY